ncbi:uncharacterized protein LOC130963690 isoform X2 [Arachis stenosperma]|uniref:uncharacterized protein LOC130963690 isoform X2 n=1 Tax=Arachis stenosperma TaxID=217475 RepID=UPI0025AC0D17|nr:uncharacterized protein LOC130963690 isoform X2 [Arachis stenosperma]
MQPFSLCPVLKVSIPCFSFCELNPSHRRVVSVICLDNTLYSETQTLMEKTPHCDFFVWFDRVFQCDGHGGEDDDALAEKVKKLKELLDSFEKKNKNAVENRQWFGCCSPVFFFILGFMVCLLVGRI